MTRIITVFILVSLMAVMLYFGVTAFMTTIRDSDQIMLQQKQEIEQILNKGN